MRPNSGLVLEFEVKVLLAQERQLLVIVPLDPFNVRSLRCGESNIKVANEVNARS